MNSLSKPLSISAVDAAKRLLGSYLIRSLEGVEVVCRIVETEAYDQTDPASHSYRGMTPRTAVMFGPAGYSYVYFTYGMYYCLNVVVGPENQAAAVLIRAVEPLSGVELIKTNRPKIVDNYMLANGPGKLCLALAVDKQLSGHDLTKEPLRLELKQPVASEDIVTTERIGISKATELKWRFYIKDNPYISRYKR
ncbi:MAG: DNA-3-methyladenine glycosylase [Candidatus Saccharibacteria bacterium]